MRVGRNIFLLYQLGERLLVPEINFVEFFLESYLVSHIIKILIFGRSLCKNSSHGLSVPQVHVDTKLDHCPCNSLDCHWHC